MSRFLALLLTCAAFAAEFPITTSPKASPLESLAAAELSTYLARLYPNDRFPVGAAKPAIRLGVGLLPGATAPESFLIRPGVISGADPRGVLYGVYALLEQLGCGFHLSGDAVTPRPDAFDPRGWKLADRPLVRDRFVFNWHNFLSSASSWEFDDWQRYLNQAARMRFNGVMVHAYGNNPMFQFTYNGQVKPVGYLATTRAGRDWGTQHVNDIRRLVGGEVFTGPVFGASVALVPEPERAAAVTALMQKVFAHAASRGLGVTFALDVDTESANPQNIIRTLPAEARFRSSAFELVNPDTPAGYAYWKAQVAHLLATYPQITRLAIWFRNNRTPWTDLKPEELPAAWRAEYAKLQPAPNAGYYAIGRLIRAVQRIVKELNRPDLELATGNWRLSTIPEWDPVMPAGITYLPLDWSTVFETPAGQRDVRRIAPGHRMSPIVWAHHDDRTYIGRPYTPFVDFPGVLKATNSSGFGIIHWTTRPLDFYFTSLARQVWEATAAEPVDLTAEHAAASLFGRDARKAGGEYLLRFVTEAPQFGRETSDRFMDIPLDKPEVHLRAITARLALLGKIQSTSPWFAYFRDYERFLRGFFESHTAYERAEQLHKRGDHAAARKEIAKANPEGVIRLYAAAARHGTMSRGEQALVISLNLRWRPYLDSLRQALGMEPVRIKFDPTQHEPLAQGAGRNTFFVDEGRRLWRQLGSPLEFDQPVAIPLTAMMGDALAPGAYTIEVAFAPGARGEVRCGEAATAIGESRARLRVDLNAPKPALVIAPRGAVRIRELTIAP
jgi:hypothetical protein